MKQPPNIHPDIVSWLESTFIPVKDTRGIDLREIDFRSGQYSVVEAIRAIAERQNDYGKTVRIPGS